MKDEQFELGKSYEHSSGKRMKIVSVADTTIYGRAFIGEDDHGNLSPIQHDCKGFPEATIGWSEIKQTMKTKKHKVNTLKNDLAIAEQGKKDLISKIIGTDKLCTGDVRKAKLQRLGAYEEKIQAIKEIINSSEAMKKHKVEIPEGYEVVDEITGRNGENDRISITIHCTPIKKPLPKTWREHCQNNPSALNWMMELPKLTDSFVALYKLILLRDVYNEGLEALSNPVSIYRKEKGDKVIMGDCVRGALVLHHDVALEFYTNFRDNLLEQAKPLL